MKLHEIKEIATHHSIKAGKMRKPSWRVPSSTPKETRPVLKAARLQRADSMAASGAMTAPDQQNIISLQFS